DDKNKRGVIVLTNMNVGADDIGMHLLDPSMPYAPPPSSATSASATSARKEVTVAADVLQQYVGEYQLAPGFTITVSRDSDKLFGQASGQGQFRLWAESPTDFFLKEVDAQIKFARDGEGGFTLTLFQNGQSTTGYRMK